MDIDEVKKFALKVWKYKEGEMVSLTIHVGDRLGLYRAMDGAGAITPSELAAATNTNERWVREWLHGQAAAGLVEHNEGRFALHDLAATVLAREGETLFFAAGAFSGLNGMDIADKVTDAMRTGLGFTFEDQGPAKARTTERMTGPSFRNLLVPLVLPKCDGVLAKLESGAVVADVGCGSGLAIEVLATAFPNSSFIGVDLSETAIARARERTADAGLGNVEFVVARAENALEPETYDVVFALDTLHDMPRPDLVLAAIRRALKPDGTLVIKDIKSSPRFEDNLKNPVLAMQYGFSLASCLASARSTEDGLGLGTLGFNPEVARQMTAEAGFSRFAMYDVDDPTNFYYEVRI